MEFIYGVEREFLNVNVPLSCCGVTGSRGAVTFLDVISGSVFSMRNLSLSNDFLLPVGSILTKTGP